MSTAATFAVGSLITARGREWIVLPKSTDELLLVRPIDGTDEEQTGILTSLETVAPAQFAPPNPERAGDHTTCRLLRDALRFHIRNSAGPFRSFGKISVDPRPYQFVPLMLALRQSPVRLMIADDVGVGKTIEAGLIIKELIERGECNRFCVICPPYLAQQWQRELADKFHLDAELVLAGTVARLERQCCADESIFKRFERTIVSIDYIKNERHRSELIANAPELIIFDEAHAVAFDTASSARHQRYRLAQKLCEDETRNIILITATPHSGNENAFRSLLALLKPEFVSLPDNLSGEKARPIREEVARYLVQRRRTDIEHFLDEETTFPTVAKKETGWNLSPRYKEFFDRAFETVQEMIADSSGEERHKRVRWWSALSLLRAMASSPAAAAATLKSRSQLNDAQTKEEVDTLGGLCLLDEAGDQSDTSADESLGCSVSEEDLATAIPAFSESLRQRFASLAQEAAAFQGKDDAKLLLLAKTLKQLVNDGFYPIVFCRFISTVDYLLEELRKIFPSKIEIVSVTGSLPPEEREQRIEAMVDSPKRVLLCTDCLSEGINLQDHFNAVIHYDLSWNPTRHEQREGRVDRFGQKSKEVRIATFYGTDNAIDGVILNILIQKHKRIKDALGVAVSVPSDSKQLVEAILSGVLKKKRSNATPLLPALEEFLQEEEKNPSKEPFGDDWINARENDTRSMTKYAHDRDARHADEIKREMAAVRTSIGSPDNVRRFVLGVLHHFNACEEPKETTGKKTPVTIHWDRLPAVLADYLPENLPKAIQFSLPIAESAEYVSRMHPITEGICDFIVNTALDTAEEKPLARRAGVIRTNAVAIRTTILLLRIRYQLFKYDSKGVKNPIPLMAEDLIPCGFSGSPDNPTWLSSEAVDPLLDAIPVGNLPMPMIKNQLSSILDAYSQLEPAITDLVRERGNELKAAHDRVRGAIGSGATVTTQRTEVRPELPPDLIGLYVFLPVPKIL